MFRTLAVIISLIATSAVADQEVEHFIKDQNCSYTEMVASSLVGAVVGYVGGSAVASAKFGRKAVSAMPEGAYASVKSQIGDIGNTWLTKPRGPGWTYSGRVDEIVGVDFSKAREASKRLTGSTFAMIGAGASYGVACHTEATKLTEDLYLEALDGVISWLEN